MEASQIAGATAEVHRQHPAAVGSGPVRISVVVSTCNRAGDLPQLFEALERQTANANGAWELVIVDNRSTDATAQTLRALAEQATFPVTCVFEGRQGKSYGLNAGIEAARGDIIAFTDDDGVPAEDWLERLQTHFDARAQAGCVGGRVELFDPADAPITIRTSREPTVVDISSFAAFDIPVIGCNMAIRRQVLHELGPYDVNLGPGARAGTAEDVDMLYRLVSGGHRIEYDPAVLVLHNHGRRTPEQIARVRSAYLMGRGAFYCKHALAGDRRVMRWAYWELRPLLGRWVRNGLAGPAARSALRDLSLIVTGAMRYLRYRVPEPSRRPDTKTQCGANNA